MLTADMGRKRQAKNRRLEKYVKVQAKKGAEYYSLHHPLMPRPKAFGTDWKRANAASVSLQAYFANAEDDVSALLGTRSPSNSLAEVIDIFKAKNLRQEKWSPTYKEEIYTRLERVKRNYGSLNFADIDIGKCREIIFSFKGDGIRQARYAMTHLYSFAIGQGLSDKFMVNYAEKVEVPTRAKRKRARIDTYQDYLNAKEKCPDWLQDAADLSLITLQGRAEVVSAKLKKNIAGDQMKFIRQKTGHAVTIDITPAVAEILLRCRERAMKLGCPFIICTTQRDTAITKAAKEHRAQVLPDYLTRKWTEHTGTAFHEIRSLGRRMYENQLIKEGMTRAQAQQYITNLTGWEDAMYELYGDTGEIKYTQAKAELKL